LGIIKDFDQVASLTCFYCGRAITKTPAILISGSDYRMVLHLWCIEPLIELLKNDTSVMHSSPREISLLEKDPEEDEVAKDRP
jgi:hypothetical protein